VSLPALAVLLALVGPDVTNMQVIVQDPGGPAPLFVPISTPGGGSGEGGTPTTPATPPPAVPEPFTWVTLLAGLGLIGWRLRHERSAGSARRAGRLPG